MAFTTVPASGAKLRASVLEDLVVEVRPVSAVKTATTSRSSTTSRTADPDLSVTLSPGVWRLEIELLVSAAANDAGDFNFDLAFPADATVDLGVHAATTGGLSAGIDAANLNINAYIQDTATPTGGHSIGASTSPTTVLARGDVTIVTAGAVTVEWAQNSSSGSATNLLAGSKIVADKLS